MIFEVLTVVKIKITALWDMTPCRFVRNFVHLYTFTTLLFILRIVLANTCTHIVVSHTVYIYDLCVNITCFFLMTSPREWRYIAECRWVKADIQLTNLLCSYTLICINGYKYETCFNFKKLHNLPTKFIYDSQNKQ